jgi:cardiolipin synthase
MALLCLGSVAAVRHGLESARDTARAAARTSGVTSSTDRQALFSDQSDGDTLAIEPSDDYRSIDDLLTTATRTIDMTMYELADPRIEQELIEAHRRDVTVRVLLDRDFDGLSVNRAAYRDLRRSGVSVRFAPASTIFHQKTVTVDGVVSAVMTGNLTSHYYPTTRDFIAFVRDPLEVSAVEATFNQDWTGSQPGPGPGTGGLIWSPGSTAALVDLIDQAKHSLVIENEEMASSRIESALEAASLRGVTVSLIMTENPSWGPDLKRLQRAGVRLAIYLDRGDALYIHAKAIVADGTTAFVGSQNFSTSSLDDNRELGLITTDSAVVAPLARVLASDFSHAPRSTTPGVRPRG